MTHRIRYCFSNRTTLIPLIFALLLVFVTPLVAADSVDVTFTFKPTDNPAVVYIPGEFNNWGNNSAGVISPGAAWTMTKDAGTGIWSKTIRLAVGGNPGGRVAGAYQYKINEGGCSSCWQNDPINQHVNISDNSNTFVYIKDPTIFHLLPNSRNPIVNTSVPAITASIFPKVGSTVDTSMLTLSIDGVLYTGIGSYYNFLTKVLTFTPPSPLANGTHTVILHTAGSADTSTFTSRGGFVQLLNEFPFTTVKSAWTINGTVTDTNVYIVQLVRNGTDTTNALVTAQNFSANVSLVEGTNSIVAVADSSGHTAVSSPVVFTRVVNHAPTGSVIVFSDSASVTLQASATDPDAGQTPSLTFRWIADAANPSVIPGLDGATTSSVHFTKPDIQGEYYYWLITTDPDSHSDTVRSYFTLGAGGSIDLPIYASNPQWAQKARIYFIFVKGFTSQGTINAAALKLQYIHDMGFNCIWLTPIMKNAYPIDNNYGIGYNIIDFTAVAPEYGTNQDLKSFIDQAHTLGIRVILDFTPNHSSRFHPWSADAHTFKSNSPYWGWYEHNKITSNTNGLGDCLDGDNFNYYCGFSDQLLNLNWNDLDLRAEMIRSLKYWITNCGVDGYRFDVYWGPHRRYGEQAMGMPIRNALKHVKPDILLLGEDDGTGSGTQTVYADYVNGPVLGGLDMAYDFKLYFNQIRGFGFNATAITNLHNEIDNGGYYPGAHSLYMRFMESQDEDRITYFYSNSNALDALTTFDHERPMASVLFTIPGIPMLYNGQEIGWGYGIGGAKEARNRSVINWNYYGKDALAPHYQKIVTIRGQFPAFTQHKRDTNADNQVTSSDSSDFVKVYSSNSLVYAFARPYTNQNGLTLVNFSSSDATPTINLVSSPALKFSTPVQDSTDYYLNNLYDNTRTMVKGADLSALTIPVDAWGTAILTVSTTPDSVTISNPITGVDESKGKPVQFALGQNYPNPFNPSTTIAYDVPSAGKVTVAVYSLLGEKVGTLVDGVIQAGHHEVVWNARSLASGVYFCRLTMGTRQAVRPMLLVR
jgi:cyclomaltodextrinase / maltogenic alpha-amylase / neopullulanase